MGVLEGRVAHRDRRRHGSRPRHRGRARGAGARDRGRGDRSRLGATRPRPELAGLGVEARAYPTDVADSGQVDATFEAVVRDFGRVDIVVNNAGISRVGPHTQDVTDEDWHDSIAVMQTGRLLLHARGRTPHAAPRGSGSVVNISSIRGFSPNPGRMTYCAPKAAVIMMTKIAAGEWALGGRAGQRDLPRRPAHADVGRRRRTRRDRRAVLPRRRPLHRLGTPAEVGRLAVYLSSDDAAYVTGAASHHRRRV